MILCVACEGYRRFITVQADQTFIAVIKQDIADIYQAALFHSRRKHINCLHIFADCKGIFVHIRIKRRLQCALIKCKTGKSGVCIILCRSNHADSEQSACVSSGALELHSHF